MPPINVAEFLLAGKGPNAVAIETLDRTCSYAEIAEDASAVAVHLHALNIAKGERVALVGDNSRFWVAAYLGCLRAGVVCAPLPESVSPETLRHVLQVTEARAVFTTGALASRHEADLHGCTLVLDGAAPAFPAAPSLDELRWAARHRQPPLPSAAGDDLAALMFTSGSTGAPRGVMVSHANIVANTESIIQYLEITAADRMMTVLPFHYCFGASLLHTHLRAGACLVLDSRFLYPEVVLQHMIDARCTGFAGVPTHFQILLRRSTLRDRSFPCLRYVQQAGGHLAPGVIRGLREALPGTRIFIMYGQTEATARLSYLPPEFLDTKLGSIGRGLPGVTLRVLDESGQPVKPGETGEIVASGANVTRGYWRSPEETAATFRDGVLYTGDIGTVDADGFIYIVGRSKDFLKCVGKRVSCRQLEEQIMECPAILEAAVVPTADEILGDAVLLYVVPRDTRARGMEEQVRTFCKSRFPPALVPREIVVRPTLPKNSCGKILKQALWTRPVPARTTPNGFTGCHTAAPDRSGPEHAVDRDPGSPRRDFE